MTKNVSITEFNELSTDEKGLVSLAWRCFFACL
jgi:hypothetical protein